MTQQAREFPIYLNTIASLMDAEVAINAMTAADEVSTDENVETREFKAISVPYGALGVHGASKALFIRLAQCLVTCGNPAELRVEWAPQRFSVDTEGGTVTAHLMVVGHSEFGDHPLIASVDDVALALHDAGIDVRGVSLVEALNMPEPKPHRFVSPLAEWSLEALFVSLMLAAYDTGQPLADIELYWREEPKLERPGVLDPKAPEVFVASARALIVAKQRIVIPRKEL